MRLPWPHSAQIVYRVVVNEAGIVLDVLLRDTERRQQVFGGMMHGRQRGALLSLGGHHPIAEVPGVLFERGQFGQRVLSHEEAPQRSVRVGVQAVLDQLPEAPALGRERVADDGLQRRIARPHDLLAVQERQHLDQDKGRCHIPPRQQRGRLDESRPVGPVQSR